MTTFKAAIMIFLWLKQKINKLFSLKAYPDVKAGIVHWPMSVVRLQKFAPCVISGSSGFHFEEMEIV